MRIVRRSMLPVELQIAPMIDLIFLLLVFFMLQPASEREKEFGLTLPGTVVQAKPLIFSDPQRLTIGADGQVSLNELPLDRPEDRNLPQLRAVLSRFSAISRAAQSPAQITLWPDDAATHQRIVEVLDACAAAGISQIAWNGTSDGAP